MSLSSLRLLQLCSANLPTGAYAFSHVLETATEEGWLTDFQTTEDWLSLQLQYSLGRTDLPILRRVMTAFSHGNTDQVRHWNRLILALRETAELMLSDCATGKALMRVLRSQQGIDAAGYLFDEADVSFVTAFAFAADQWAISPSDAYLGYGWSWLENQVAAATKLVPLGQTQSQQLLENLQPKLLRAIDTANHCLDDDIGESLPMLAVASCWHEHQYSRLFRS